MTALIITYSDDNDCIPLVIDAIEAKGGTAFRFDTDRFPTDVQLDIYSGHSDRILMTDNGQQLDLREVSAVWYRRVRYGHQLPDSMDPQFRDAAINECRTTVRGLLASLPGFHLDNMSHVERAENKQLQLQVARELGLMTPRTLTSNNPETVKQFARECRGQIITKMLSSFAIYGDQGEEQVVFTNRVTDEDLEHLEGLRLCPMTFQENVPKALELRTTIVGHRVFTAAVDSQQLDGATDDWRKAGEVLMQHWQPYHLPEEIEQKLLNLMDSFGLNYGAIDLIVTPDGRHVFLEINPVGEFFWLEFYSPYFPISQAIAELLIAPNHF